MDNTRKYLQRCIELAQKGALTCAPNPMVGAVVVGPDGRILGEGYHVRAGEAHAEVNALNAVRREDWPLLKESTIYVSLEPCAHYGRTPPCAELIVKRGLRRCVVGCKDPFTRVNGRGIQILVEAGIEVELAPDDIQQQCLLLNRKFICQHRLGRPFITLKWAEASVPGQPHQPIIGLRGERLHISTPQSLMWGHQLRAQHQAIVVGHNTLTADSPRLDVRHWAVGSQSRQGNTPQPYVLGRCSEDELPRGWQAFATIDDLLEHLQRQGVQSLLVEGGAQVLQSFIERDLWDEAYAERATLASAPSAEGVPAPQMPTEFPYTDEPHFGSTFRHWLSPLWRE